MMNKKEKMIELLVERAIELDKVNEPEKLKNKFENFTEEILEHISILDNDDFSNELEVINL